MQSLVQKLGFEPDWMFQQDNDQKRAVKVTRAWFEGWLQWKSEQTFQSKQARYMWGVEMVETYRNRVRALVVNKGGPNSYKALNA